MHHNNPEKQASNPAVNDTTLPAVATAVAKSETTDADRDNDYLFNFYMSKDTSDAVKGMLDRGLNEKLRKRVFDTSMQELDEAIKKNLKAGSDAEKAARAMYDKLNEYWTHQLISYEDKFALIRKTTRLVAAAPGSADFTARSESFAKSLDIIKSKGAWNIVWGIGATLLTVLAMGAIAVSALVSGGVIPFIVQEVAHWVCPIVATAGALTLQKSIPSAIGFFFSGHEHLSMAKCMTNLTAGFEKDENNAKGLKN